MSLLSSAAITVGRITTLLQVILYLPLTLDVAGQDAFLALSASLAVYYAFLSTARIITKRTSLAWLGDLLAVFQFIVVPACLLIVFNVYSPPSESYFNKKYSEINATIASPTPSQRPGFFASLSTGLESKPAYQNTAIDEPFLGEIASQLLHRLLVITFFLARNVPPWWHMFLRFSSPVFSLLEGIATLLVIQVVGSFSRWLIARSLNRRPPTPQPSYFSWFPALISSLTSAEFLQIFFLLIAALVYVCSALALYISFEGATRNRSGTAAATGAAISSTLWLTAIAFAVRRGNVMETSLMFAYVVWNVYQLSDSLSFTADPLALIRSFKVLDTSTGSALMHFPRLLKRLPPILVTLIDILSHALGQSARFIVAAAAALPKSVIVSLIYRLMVLYSASRILPLLKRGGPSKGWEGDGSSWGSASNTGSSSSSSSSEESDDSSSSITTDSDLEEKRGKSSKGKQRNGTPKKDLKGKAAQSSPEQRRKRIRRNRDELRLSEEEPFGAFISLIVSYSRLILIAVYSHLLLLDQSHMVYWRFLTVGITLFVWALELILGKDDNPDAALW